MKGGDGLIVPVHFARPAIASHIIVEPVYLLTLIFEVPLQHIVPVHPVKSDINLALVSASRLREVTSIARAVTRSIGSPPFFPGHTIKSLLTVVELRRECRGE